MFKFLIIIWPHFETMVLRWREYQGDRGDWVMLPISYLTLNWKCWCTLSILLFSRVSVRGISVWTYCQLLNLCLCYRTLPPAGAPGASRRSSRGSGRAKEISRLSRLSDQLIKIPSMLPWVLAEIFICHSLNDTVTFPEKFSFSWRGAEAICGPIKFVVHEILIARQMISKNFAYLSQ